MGLFTPALQTRGRPLCQSPETPSGSSWLTPQGTAKGGTSCLVLGSGAQPLPSSRLFSDPFLAARPPWDPEGSSLGFRVQVLVPACPEPSGVQPSPGPAKAVATLPSRWLGFIGPPPAQRPPGFCLHYRGKGRARNRKETGQGVPAREGWEGGPPWPARPCRNGAPSGLGALDPATANTGGKQGVGGHCYLRHWKIGVVGKKGNIHLLPLYYPSPRFHQ